MSPLLVRARDVVAEVSRRYVPAANRWLTVGAVAAVALGLVLIWPRGAGEGVEARLAMATPAPDLVQPTILVHVSGQVVRPGVLELAVDSRVGDAIAAAGGLLVSADIEAINLAARVSDGARLHVPEPGEEPRWSGPAQAVGAARVDVNVAPQSELEALPGIGPALAAAVVAHREDHGRFRSVDQLVEVPGIGPAKLEVLRDLVSTG